MVELSEKQRQELEQSGHLFVIDAATNEQYVIMRASIFEQIADNIDYSPWSPEEMDQFHEDAGAMLDHFGR